MSHSFDNLDGFFDAQRHLGEHDVAYIALHHNEPGNAAMVAKFTWSEASARAHGLDEDDLFAAADDWVRQEAIGQTATGTRQFRIKVCGPKGLDQHASRVFRCSAKPPPLLGDDALPLLDELASIDLDDAETMEDIDALLAVPGFRANAAMQMRTARINAAVHENAARLMLFVQTLVGRTVDQLHRELESARAHNADLVKSITAERLQTIEAAEAEFEKNRKRLERAETVQVLADKVQSIGSQWMAAHAGVPPEFIEILGRNPSLMAKLADPKLKRLLGDPSSVAMLDSLLAQLPDEPPSDTPFPGDP